MRLSLGCLCFNARVIQGCNGVPPVKGAIVYGSLLTFIDGLLYTKRPQFTFYTERHFYLVPVRERVPDLEGVLVLLGVTEGDLVLL